MGDADWIKTRVEIGVRVRERRKELGLTQCELAAFLGHRDSCRINQVELGRRRLYVDELPKLCEKLACSLSDIVSPEADPDDPGAD